MSIVSEAFKLRRKCRDEFELYIEAQFYAAHEACNGVLLSRLGKAQKIEPRSLFLGSADRANLYSSAELQEWWERHRRLNYRMFEEQWTNTDRDYEPF